MNMLKHTVCDFDFPFADIPIIEVDFNSTSNGKINITNESIEQVNLLTAELYEVEPPNSEYDYWQKLTSDLNDDIITLTSWFNSLGQVVISYNVDPALIDEVAHGKYYNVSILVNQESDAKAKIDFVLKINNNIG
jgi:hypothetical protein